jgi:hypothetical protein
LTSIFSLPQEKQKSAPLCFWSILNDSVNLRATGVHRLTSLKASLLASPETARPIALLIRNFEVELLHLLQEGGRVVADPLENSDALAFTAALSTLPMVV